MRIDPDAPASGEDGYQCFNGTSAAAPHVAGVAALVISHFDPLVGFVRGNPVRVRDTLLDNVVVYPDEPGEPCNMGLDCVQTHGRINACRALGRSDCAGGADSGLVAVQTFVERTRERMPTAFGGQLVNDVDLFDADGDGYLDLFSVMLKDTDALVGRPLLFINGGTGVFKNETDARVAPPGGTGPLNLGAADQADLDGDGWPDIVVAHFRAPTAAQRRDRLYRNRGAAGRGIFDDYTGVLPKDTTEDRDIDVCYLDPGNPGVPYLVRSGARSFSICRRTGAQACFDNEAAWPCFADETSSRAPAVDTWAPLPDSHNSLCADIDGRDGPDIFITDADGENRLLINAGDGTFTEGTAAWSVPSAPGEGHFRDAEAADLDGDGDLDVALALRDQQQNRILINTGASFQDQTASCPSGGRRLPKATDTTSEVDVLDADCDGDLDLLFLNGGLDGACVGAADPEPGVCIQANAFYLNEGGGCFSAAPASYGLPSPVADMSADAAVGDADGDGDGDVIIANWGEPDQIFVNTTCPGAAPCCLP